jgi:hypothetical protein
MGTKTTNEVMPNWYLELVKLAQIAQKGMESIKNERRISEDKS